MINTEQGKYIRKKGEGTTNFIGSPGDDVVTNVESVTFYEFTIEAPKERVWDVLKDISAWITDIKWDCVLGEESMQGNLVGLQSLGVKMPDGNLVPKRFQKVLNVIPGKLILWSDPVVKNDNDASSGVYVTTLAEYDGVTTVTTTLIKQFWFSEMSEEQKNAYGYWIDNINQRWEEVYIPNLRKLVLEK